MKKSFFVLNLCIVFILVLSLVSPTFAFQNNKFDKLLVYGNTPLPIGWLGVSWWSAPTDFGDKIVGLADVGRLSVYVDVELVKDVISIYLMFYDNKFACLVLRCEDQDAFIELMKEFTMYGRPKPLTEYDENNDKFKFGWWGDEKAIVVVPASMVAIIGTYEGISLAGNEIAKVMGKHSF